MNGLSHRINFDLIRYANCWEDTDVLLDALALQDGKRIFCIASAGDHAFSLLTTNPQTVVAVDISLPQLYLIALKRAAFVGLEYHEMLGFLGVHPCVNRIVLFQKIADLLTTNERQYWLTHIAQIENGIIHAGKFEGYFRFFRKYLIPLVHSKRSIQKLLSPKSAEQQILFFNKEWNTLRWQLLMRMFFSKTVMGKYGRDPEFLKQVNIPVPQYIKKRANAHLTSVNCQENYLLHYMFTGSFGAVLPHYLRKENHELIRKNLHKITLLHQDAEQVITNQQFDAYCCSNMFEYIGNNDFNHLVERWSSYIPAKSIIAYWNLMVPRMFSEIKQEQYIYHSEVAQYETIDRGFFYSRFIVETRK